LLFFAPPPPLPIPRVDYCPKGMSMYFVKTPILKVEGHNEQALREQIEGERRDLHNALKNVGIANPPVELRIDASNPRPDCIFFAYREGLLRDAYDAQAFAQAYTAHAESDINHIKDVAMAHFKKCHV
jgi:hypothetical protein